MLNNSTVIQLVNAWRSKARNANPPNPIEADTLETCANQLVQLLKADTIEVRLKPEPRQKAS